jgi:hypothetical protein
MGRYSVTQRTEERPWEIHPIWRGIGCFMILIIILLGYTLAKEAVDYNQRTQKLVLPDVVYKAVQIPYLNYIPALKKNDVVNKFLAQVKYGYLFFGLVFMFIGFGAFSLVYSALYRASGPSRYIPVDSPEVRRMAKPRKPPYRR